MRSWRRVLAVVLLSAAALFTWMHREARADPIVRRATLHVPDWPAGAAPVRVLLMSDVHLGNTVMDEPRLRRIVAQANALHPDLVLIAGDFVAGHDRALGAIYAPRLVAPLAQLRAPLGVVAVPGNHDYWVGHSDVVRALRGAGVMMLENDAVRRGPLAIGGTADAYTAHADVSRTLAALRPLGGARVILTHSPDVSPAFPRDIPLVLAGHTHCGQIVLPLIGPIVAVARPHYRCGIVRDGARLTVVTAGIGTSRVPLRLGAPPDMWLLMLGP